MLRSRIKLHELFSWAHGSRAAAGAVVQTAALGTPAGSSRAGYHVARLASRGVISLKGSDAVNFLQASKCDSPSDQHMRKGPDERFALPRFHPPIRTPAPLPLHPEQGMTTNDIRPLEQPCAGPLYTVLLTAKGKYLHDCFAYSAPRGTGEHL